MTSKTQWVNEIYEKMEQKLYAECARMGEKIPYWTVGGVYEEDYAKKDIYWWTNGFWSGILWQLYHATKNELYLETARKNEDLLDQALHGFIGLHHDTGFMWPTALSLITASQVPKKPKSAASMQPLFWPEDTIQTENLSGHGILNV